MKYISVKYNRKKKTIHLAKQFNNYYDEFLC